MKNRIAIFLTLPLTMALSVSAYSPQTDIADFNPNRWNSETMVFAQVQVEGTAVGTFTLCAYIGDELRGFATAPESFAPNNVYALRVKGDSEDMGKPIDIVVVNGDDVYSGSDVAVSQPLAWTGEMIGLPSDPVVISVLSVVMPTEIKVEEGYVFYRQDYSAENPLSLSALYTVLPENATDKSVTMELTAGSRNQGRLEQRSGEWVFIPSANCNGEIDIRILSKVDPMVGALLTIEARARAEEIVIYDEIIEMEVGEVIDLTAIYRVMPADAYDKSVTFSCGSNVEIVDDGDGSYSLRALASGEDTVEIALAANPDVKVTIQVVIRPAVETVEVMIMQHGDDVESDPGVVTAYRQAMLTPRSFKLVSKPAGTKLNADLLEWTITRTGADYPADWAEYGKEVVEDTDEGLEIAITPYIPGVYSISCAYNGTNLTESAWEITVLMGAELQKGWNWFGSCVKNDGEALSNVLADKNSLIEARTQSSVLVNDPVIGYAMGFRDSNGAWTNDFTLDAQRDNGHFRIKLKDEEAFDGRILYGGDFDFIGAQWMLVDGWNWVNAPAIYRVPVSMLNDYAAFSEEDVIKSNDRLSIFTTYGWSGSLQYLEPGAAYSLYKADGGIFSFDFSQLEQYVKTGHSYAPSEQRWSYDASKYFDNMGIVAEVVNSDDEAYMLSENDYSLGVFAGDECRGEGHLVCGRWYIIAHGESGDVFTFKLRDEATGLLTDFVERVEFAPMAGSYQHPIIIKATGLSALDDIKGDRSMIYVSGNTIVGADCIYNMQGCDITAANGCLIPGIYIAIANGTTCKVIVK